MNEESINGNMKESNGLTHESLRIKELENKLDWYKKEQAYERKIDKIQRDYENNILERILGLGNVISPILSQFFPKKTASISGLTDNENTINPESQNESPINSEIQNETTKLLKCLSELTGNNEGMLLILLKKINIELENDPTKLMQMLQQNSSDENE